MPKTKEKESLSSYDKFLVKKEKNNIAINMLKNNETNDKISSYTGLKISEIEELKKNLK